MTPHDDRRTSHGPAPLDRDRPGTIAAVFPSSRRIARNGTVSVCHDMAVLHRAQANWVFCNQEEQNNRQITDVTGISDSSLRSRVNSSRQSWGRRRYGPVRPTCRMA